MTVILLLKKKEVYMKTVQATRNRIFLLYLKKILEKSIKCASQYWLSVFIFSVDTKPCVRLSSESYRLRWGIRCDVIVVSIRGLMIGAT